VGWLHWGLLPVLVTVFLVCLEYRDKYVVLCGTYVVVAVFIGAIFLGGDGVDTNAMFDADIALALTAALVVSRWAKKPIYQPASVILYVIPLIFWIGVESHGLRNVPHYLPQAFYKRLHVSYWIDPLADETRVVARDIAFLRGQAGPVVCEMLALCYWADKSPQLDVFNVGQQFLMKKRSDEELVSLVKQKRYAALQFLSFSEFLKVSEPTGGWRIGDPEALQLFALTPPVREAILLRYGIDHIDSQGVFLLPINHRD
jgi:hypothetical protein